MSETSVFLETLFGDLRPNEYIEHRFIPTGAGKGFGVRQRWVQDLAESATVALHPPKGYNSYVGVLPRTAASEGSIASCRQEVGVLWADIDSYKAEGRTLPGVLEELRHLACPPTMVVGSGGGLHVYWALSDTVTHAEARQLMRAISKRVKGDPATCEPARVLRVPGTANTKLESPRMVRLEVINYGNRHSSEAMRACFESAGSATPVLDVTPVLGARTRAFLATGELPDDDQPERNHLLGVARNLHSNGYRAEDAAALLGAAIERHMQTGCPRCRPDDPWTERHINKIVESIWSSEPTTELTAAPAVEFELVASPVGGRLVPLTDEDFNNRDPELHYLVDRWLLRREIVQLTGGFGVGKSWLALDLALAIADKQRESWIGSPVTEHGPVVYFDEENDTDALLERLAFLGYRSGLLGNDLSIFSFAGVELDKPDWQKELHSFVETVRPALCVFDTFIRFFSQDENDNSAVARIYRDALVPLSRMYGSAVLVLDHPRKGTSDISRGASDKVNVLDRAWSFKGTPGDDVATLGHIKPPRRGRMPHDVRVQRQMEVGGVQLVALDEEVEPVTPGRPKNKEVDDTVLGVLIKDGPMSHKELVASTGIPERTASRALKRLEDAEIVLRDRGLWRPTVTEEEQ